MAATLGIDFGTHRCHMAAVVDGQLRALLGRNGKATNSTIVLARDDILIGVNAAKHIGRAIDNCNRLLGRKFNSPEIGWLSSYCAYSMVEAENGDIRIPIGKRHFSPEELCSFLLAALYDDAVKQLGQVPLAINISVPAVANKVQRLAILQAAQLAGLPEVTLINAGAATAVGIACQGDSRGRLAVVDLGGGNLSATMAEIDAGSVRICSATGDTLLGGDDFDQRVIAYIAEELLHQHNIELPYDSETVAWLRSSSRLLRHKLSVMPTATLDYEGRRIELNNATFAELVEDEVNGLSGPLKQLLIDTKEEGPIEALVLTGGCSKSPLLQQAIAQHFSCKVLNARNGGQLNAQGAAFVAAVRQGQLGGPELRDRTTRSNCIKVRGGSLRVVMPRLRLLPARQRIAFSLARDGIDQVTLELYEGESAMPTRNAYLGRLLVSGLDKLANPERFDIEFEVDDNNMLRVEAGVDGQALPARLVWSGGLSPKEINSLLDNRASRRRAPELSANDTVPLPGRGMLAELEKPEQVIDEEDIAPPPDSKPIAIDSDSLVGEVIGERYRIVQLLGEGGMGCVYLAEHSVLERHFAVKVLHPELASNKRLADRFVREAKSASSIRHPHVVDIVDFGHLPTGSAYFVMEYVAGSTLAQLLSQHVRLQAGAVKNIGIQICQGLAAAHARGIIHRDLKPENITISEVEQGRLICKILDFGIAKSSTSDSAGEITLAGSIMGTPEYVAPEQIDGNSVDARTDVYSLGVMMYELVTGVTPFANESVAKVMASHKWDEVPRFAEVAPRVECSLALENAILRCLEKKPEDRFQNAKEFGSRLTQIDS